LASEPHSSRIIDGQIVEGQIVEGLWRAPGVARAKPARLSVDATGIASVGDAQTGEALSSEAFAKLSVSDRVGSIPRRVDFADGSSFETRDNDGIDRLLRPYRGPRSGLVHELERFRPRLIVFVALVLALSVGIYRFAVPVLVEVAVLATPPIVPQLMSRSLLASLDGTVFEPSGLSQEKQKSLTDGFDKLAALTPRGLAALTAPDHPAYTLNFRKGGPIGPNAFALPDGTVILTDELVALANNDEFVLGVLAHEIGHVEHQHSLRQLYRAAGASALIMLIGGDIGSGAEDILVQGSALLSLSYSRNAETEADRHSVELMHKAGRDPRAIGHFLELIRDKLGDKEERDFLSTHPATPERIAETLRYADEVAGKQ
jgi:Zn-dependent protease with chaperone function